MNAFAYVIDDSLELRLLEMRHADELFQLTDANRAYLEEFLPWVDDIGSYKDACAYIREGLQQFAANDGFQAGIWKDDALIGCINYHSIDWNNRKTELGYWIDESHSGQGIMTRCVEALLIYAFEVYMLNRVVIRAAVTNTRSRAIAERLGFTLEGILRADIRVNGEYVDHAVYGLLSPEWRAR